MANVFCVFSLNIFISTTCHFHTQNIDTQIKKDLCVFIYISKNIKMYEYMYMNILEPNFGFSDQF